MPGLWEVAAAAGALVVLAVPTAGEVAGELLFGAAVSMMVSSSAVEGSVTKVRGSSAASWELIVAAM